MRLRMVLAAQRSSRFTRWVKIPSARRRKRKRRARTRTTTRSATTLDDGEYYASHDDDDDDVSIIIIKEKQSFVKVSYERNSLFLTIEQLTSI